MGLLGGLVVALLSAGVAQAPVAIGNALTLPAQRHLVRVDPGDGQGAIWMLAIQQDGANGQGLGWYRSDDEAQSFRYVGPIQNDWSERDVADLITVGKDIAMVYSYENNVVTPSTRHDVFFQWWRYQAASRSYSAGPVVKIFDASGSNAFSRAELARDSAGRIWVQAFRMDGTSDPNGDHNPSSAMFAVSTDGGNTFTNLGALDQVPDRGGGRLLWLGNELVFVYGMHDGFVPARMRIHRDSDPVGTWGPVQQAFSSGEGIYHGAALSASADGTGGMHLVYKNEDDERMYYRHFDGSTFGSPVLIDDSSDWALQPAITTVGEDLYIFYNHVFTGNTNYDWRYRRLHAGSFSSPVVLDSTQNWKGYPSAVEMLPTSVALIPCFFAEVPAGQDAGNAVVVYAPDVTTGGGGGIDAGVPDAGAPDGGGGGGGGVDAGTPDAGGGGGADAGVPPPGTVLFSDSFSRTTSDSQGLGGSWTVTGLWYDQGSVAVSDLDGQDFAWETAAKCADCQVQAKLDGFGVPHIAIFDRAPSVGSQDRYQLDLLGNGHIQIQKIRSGVTTVLADVASGLASLSNPATLALSVVGAGPVQLVAFVNGVQKVSAVDSSSNALTAAGYAGLYTTNAGVYFDDFQLAQLGSGGGSVDAGTPDAGVPDAGTPDAGTPDAGIPDAGTPRDGGTPDAGTPDAGVPDAGVPDAGTPDAGTDAGVLFTDEFNRSGALGSNWTIAGGAWTDNGTAATGTAAQSYAFWVGNPAANDTASITISTPIRNTYIGVIVHATPSAPAANHYVGYVDPGGSSHIARRNGSTYTFLADGPAFPSGSHVLSLTATGSSPVVLSLKVDGVQVLSYSDSSASALAATGKAGMVDYNGAGQPVDRFVVTDPPAGPGGSPDAGTPAPDAGTPDAGSGGGTVDAGTPPPPPDAGSGTQITLTPVYTDTSKMFMAVDASGTAYSVSLSDQGTLLASNDAKSWSVRGTHPAGAGFFLMTSLSDNTLLADVVYGGSHHIARSTNHGANWTTVLDLNGYRTLTPHNIAELDGSVYVLEYQDFTESSTTIRLWRSDDDGQTWTTRFRWTTHRHGHGLIADPAHHALWALFGDTDPQAAVELSTDGGGTFSVMLTGQPGDVVDGFALSDGSILFGQDISYLPPTPHIARLTLGGQYTEIASLPGPSYGAHKIASGGYIVSAEREPGGDIYPAGEISAHVFASLDGTHWADLLDYPWGNSNDIVRADVYFELPNGQLVLELYNANGFGAQGYQLLQVGRR